MRKPMTTIATTPRYEDIAVGLELPVLTKQPREIDLFLFSAVTWDTHRTHWDIPYATEKENLPGGLVHGHLQGAYLGQLLTDWLGPEGRLVRLGYQNRAMAIQGDQLDCKARVTERREEDGRGLVVLQVWVEKPSGEVTTTGEATVELPKRDA
jgi:hydroxyacyl-ACP dehydratase HTD2-like protein with hotdog domain